MIWNIIDKRHREYRWNTINAAIEDVSADNSCADSDQAEINTDAIHCVERTDIQLHDAIVWAEAAPVNVTLYLYDQDEGIDQA